MNALGPRRCEPNAWQGWVWAALELIWRRIGAFSVCTVVATLALMVAYSVTWAPVRVFLVLLLTALALALFVRLALVADYNRAASSVNVSPGNLDVAVAVTIGAALFAAYGAFLPGVFAPLAASLEQSLIGLGVYEPRLASGAPAPPPATQFLIGVICMAGGVWGVAAFGAGVGLLACGQWFLLPMVILHAASPGMGMAMSLRAYLVNPAPLTGLLGILLGMLTLVLASLGWLGTLLLPVLGALLYTSYRDVFLERDTNHPPGEPIPTAAELLHRSDDSPHGEA